MKKRQQAIALLASMDAIAAARDVLEAAGCGHLVVGGTTPDGTCFLLTQPTTPQLRGMMREVIAKHAKSRRD